MAKKNKKSEVIEKTFFGSLCQKKAAGLGFDGKGMKLAELVRMI